MAQEFLNEATVTDPEQWNQLVNKVYTALRENEPDRYFAIGSNRQHVDYFKDLRVPNDKRIILEFHHYDPVIITHYKAPWAEFKRYTGDVQYPGDVMMDTSFYEEFKDVEDMPTLRAMCGYWDVNRMEKDFLKAIKMADSLDLEIYCGEFGVYPREISQEIKERWYKDFTIVDENGELNSVGKILLSK